MIVEIERPLLRRVLQCISHGRARKILLHRPHPHASLTASHAATLGKLLLKLAEERLLVPILHVVYGLLKFGSIFFQVSAHLDVAIWPSRLNALQILFLQVANESPHSTQHDVLLILFRVQAEAVGDKHGRRLLTPEGPRLLVNEAHVVREGHADPLIAN